jgi:Thaumatin family
MMGGRTKRRSLRIAVLVAAAAGPAVALVTACSATGGTPGAGAPARAHAITGTPHAAAPAADVRAAAVSRAAATPSAPAPHSSPGSSSSGAATGSPAGPTAASGSPAAASPARAPARAAAAAGAHLVTFVNRVSQTIWVGAAQNPAHPLARTGWKLLPGHRLTITVPKHWNGRFWGRTGCVFRAGRGHCQSGDCGGRYQCAGNGPSRPPWPSTT